jgi:hypothetical protein
MYGAASDSERMIRPLAVARGSVTVAAAAYHCLNRRCCLLIRLIAVRGLLALQRVHEEVLQPPLGDRTSSAVIGAGNYQDIEILACLNQGVHKPHSRFRRHVRIQLAHNQEKATAEFVGIIDVGILRILFAQRNCPCSNLEKWLDMKPTLICIGGILSRYAFYLDVIFRYTE